MAESQASNNSLSHTTWNCMYDIVFAPKYRRKVFYGEKRMEIREILRQLCQWKGVEILEGRYSGSYPYAGKHTAEDECIRVHGVSEGEEQPDDDIPKVCEYEICIQEPGIRCRGYYVDTTGNDTKAIERYIQNQLKIDQENDQLSLFDPRDPFTGSK